LQLVFQIAHPTQLFLHFQHPLELLLQDNHLLRAVENFQLQVEILLVDFGDILIVVN
jgi:hypothetical protein